MKITHYTRKELLKHPSLVEEVEGLIASAYAIDHSVIDLQQVFIATDGDAVAGVAGLCCYHGSWCLRMCVVRTDCRGKNLQRKLIQSRIDYLKAERPKAKYVNVWVSPDNIPSRKNLEACGFETLREKKRFHGVVHLKMRKSLWEEQYYAIYSPSCLASIGVCVGAMLDHCLKEDPGCIGILITKKMFDAFGDNAGIILVDGKPTLSTTTESKANDRSKHTT